MSWKNISVERGYGLYLLSLLIFGLYGIQHSRAEEEIIKSGSCSKDFYESSHTEASDAHAWSLDSSLKTCFVCNQGNTKQSWFVSKLFKTNNAELVHVNITMSFSMCPRCLKQSLKVFVVHKAIPKNVDENEVIKELNKLPLLKEIKNKTEPEIKETYNIQFVPTSKVFSIVLLGEGACLVVDKFKVNYFYCEKASIKGVTLPRTVSPASGNRTVNSSCFNNTVFTNERVFGLCSSDGKWKSVTPCLCKIGFSFGSKGCFGCQRDMYKANIGNTPCLPCPLNSESAPQAVRCECKTGFYRFSRNKYTDICHGIPSEVPDVKLLRKTASSVVIQWLPPLRKINRVFYDINCFKCRGEVCEDPCGNKPTYKPSKSNFTWTNVTVENLEASTQYMFVVHSRNNNSVLTDPSNWLSARKKVKTEDSPSVPNSRNNVLIIPLVVVSSVLLTIILLVIFHKKLGCCKGKTNQNKNNVNVAHVQQPHPVITVSADTEYLDMDDFNPKHDATYESPREDAYEHPYMALSSDRQPENQYQSLELTTDHVGQASKPLYENTILFIN